MANKALKARYSSCTSVHTLQHQGALPAHTACMTVTGAKVYDFLTPMHVWELDTPFGRITRRLYYGTEEILKPKPSFEELVPNIGTIFVGIITHRQRSCGNVFTGVCRSATRGRGEGRVSQVPGHFRGYGISGSMSLPGGRVSGGGGVEAPSAVVRILLECFLVFC